MKLVFIILLISLSVPTFCQSGKGAPVDHSKPFVLGVTDEIQSGVLAEKRIVNIYLPYGYSINDTIKYPVIYLLDGGADEDFIHIAGLVQFNNFTWIDRVPKSIVVGIANVDRKRDFTYPTLLKEYRDIISSDGGSGKFIAFIENELFPFIERKYKANNARTLIGESLGGLLATEILLKKPALFSKYIIVSPSLWWDNGSLLKLSSVIFQSDYALKTDIYIGVGKEGLGPGETPHVMEVDANVLADKIQSSKSKNIHVYFDYLPNEDHATIYHQAVANAFRLIYHK